MICKRDHTLVVGPYSYILLLYAWLISFKKFAGFEEIVMS